MFEFTAPLLLMVNHILSVDNCIFHIFPHICQWLFTAAYKLLYVLYFVVFNTFIICEEHAFLCQSSVTRLARLVLAFLELAFDAQGCCDSVSKVFLIVTY